MEAAKGVQSERGPATKGGAAAAQALPIGRCPQLFRKVSFVQGDHRGEGLRGARLARFRSDATQVEGRVLEVAVEVVQGGDQWGSGLQLGVRGQRRQGDLLRTRARTGGSSETRVSGGAKLVVEGRFCRAPGGAARTGKSAGGPSAACVAIALPSSSLATARGPAGPLPLPLPLFIRATLRARLGCGEKVRDQKQVRVKASAALCRQPPTFFMHRNFYTIGDHGELWASQRAIRLLLRALRSAAPPLTVFFRCTHPSSEGRNLLIKCCHDECPAVGLPAR